MGLIFLNSNYITCERNPSKTFYFLILFLSLCRTLKKFRGNFRHHDWRDNLIYMVYSIKKYLTLRTLLHSAPDVMQCWFKSTNRFYHNLFFYHFPTGLLQRLSICVIQKQSQNQKIQREPLGKWIRVVTLSLVSVYIIYKYNSLINYFMKINITYNPFNIAVNDQRKKNDNFVKRFNSTIIAAELITVINN